VSSTTTLLRQLEAYVQEEIGAQGRIHTLLEAQSAALSSGVPARISESTRALDAETESAQRRGARRATLIAGLAQAWGLAASSLTLSSIVARTADEGERLARQRLELERAVLRVRKLTRRNNTIARFHQRLSADLLQAVLAPENDARVTDGGTLVDAEA